MPPLPHAHVAARHMKMHAELYRAWKFANLVDQDLEQLWRVDRNTKTRSDVRCPQSNTRDRGFENCVFDSRYYISQFVYRIAEDRVKLAVRQLFSPPPFRRAI